MKTRTWVGLLIGLLIVVPAAIFGYSEFHGQTYYAQVGNLHHSYIEKSDAGKAMGKVYVYKMTGYDKAGKAKALTVSSMAGVKFTKGHYVKIVWSENKGVKSYARVQWREIPKAARTRFNLVD